MWLILVKDEGVNMMVLNCTSLTREIPKEEPNQCPLSKKCKKQYFPLWLGFLMSKKVKHMQRN